MSPCIDAFHAGEERGSPHSRRRSRDSTTEGVFEHASGSDDGSDRVPVLLGALKDGVVHGERVARHQDRAIHVLRSLSDIGHAIRGVVELLGEARELVFDSKRLGVGGGELRLPLTFGDDYFPFAATGNVLTEYPEHLLSQLIVFDSTARPARHDPQRAILLDLESRIARLLGDLDFVRYRLVQNRAVKRRYVVTVDGCEGEGVSDHLRWNLGDDITSSNFHWTGNRGDRESVGRFGVRDRDGRLLDHNRQFLDCSGFGDRRNDRLTSASDVNRSSLLPGDVIHSGAINREGGLRSRGRNKTLESTHLSLEFVFFDDDNRFDFLLAADREEAG